ncbi:MAG: TylF/MycF/NovP-related O-methyltransferase, partial [Casimicrobiaceae bacterium]
MKQSRWASWRRKQYRSLVRRGLVPVVHASDAYVVQHVPEWLHASAFDFAALRALWNERNPRNDRVDLVRLLMFIENARQLEKDRVEGSVAELGVYRGTTAKVLHTLLPQRRLYLFDTFEGFDARDLAHGDAGGGSSGQFMDTSLAAVARFLGDSPLIRLCPGYFPGTAAQVPEDERFALVHLDADLFKPTWDALEFFYPRVTPGGFIVLHDYSSKAWPGIAEAV